ncbi:hypothetical protein K491DRAFT_720033 [Lophiostoma macrostomum CBS 122681]|uniref:F-box domain-containing protein n=1 Tax=Lophiostoma macrostomum CBS 122681 TaxID=1314788 RepID=A0A6A6SU00_9PLEO|nr:hypothetical protein K491DRAFT_720033 [Lophiostoma macrostomum CBS 122681]
MSIHALSTELDTRVIELLNGNHKALDAMSRVSKYYRGLSEPFLYRKLKFSTNSERRIHCLFLTILSRKDLAKHIKIFKLINCDDLENPKDNKEESYYRDLLSRMCDIRDTIETISARCVSAKVKALWLSSVFKGFPSFDGALAIILCLATNVETLSLSTSRQDHLPVTLWLLDVQWNQHANLPTYPFCKVKNFSLLGGSHIPLLPSMQTILIKEGLLYRAEKPIFLRPFHSTGLQAHLRALVLHNVGCHPRIIEKALSYPEFQTLKAFVVDGCKCPSAGYDFRRVTNALELHIPQIEEFGWSTQENEKDDHRDLSHLPMPFKTFRNLQNLKTLRVDLELLNGKETRDLNRAMTYVLACPQDLFPPGLQHLHITDIEMKVIDDLCEHFAKKPQDYPAALQVITNIAASFPVKELDLSVLMETWVYDWGNGTQEWEDGPLEFLRLVADELHKIGVICRVWRQRGHAGAPTKGIVKAGFTEPRPHWRDVSTDFWAGWCKREWGPAIGKQFTEQEIRNSGG